LVLMLIGVSDGAALESARESREYGRDYV